MIWRATIIQDRWAYVSARAEGGRVFYAWVELKDYAYQADALEAARSKVLEQIAALG